MLINDLQRKIFNDVINFTRNFIETDFLKKRKIIKLSKKREFEEEMDPQFFPLCILR